MCNSHRLPRNASRRDVLKYTLAGAGLVALGPLNRHWMPAASGAVAAQTTLSIVNMFGGNDGLNMVVPRTLASYHTVRPTIAIPAGLELALTSGPNPNSNYGLNPRLVNVKALWDEGRVAIVNLVGYPNGNESHFESEDIWSFGMRNGFGGTGLPVSGWIARYADQYAPTPLGAMSVGVGRRRDFVGGSTNPLLVSRLRDFRFLPDSTYGNNHTHRLNTIKQMLQNSGGGGPSGDARASLDSAHALVDQVQAAITSYTSTVVYPNNSFGGYMRDISRLVQAGFPTRIFYTGLGGFDTHSEQNAVDPMTGLLVGQHANLMTSLDNGIAAFVADAKAMGTWPQTSIVVISEFGRRNYENGSLGTDHAEAACVLVIGGAVNGGVYGPDLTEAMLNDEVLEHQVDFRDIYREILSDHLGAGNLATVFPETQTFNTTLGLV
jgi:uncharacterized protein (DUF1501 family)